MEHMAGTALLILILLVCLGFFGSIFILAPICIWKEDKLDKSIGDGSAKVVEEEISILKQDAEVLKVTIHLISSLLNEMPRKGNTFDKILRDTIDVDPNSDVSYEEMVDSDLRVRYGVDDKLLNFKHQKVFEVNEEMSYPRHMVHDFTVEKIPSEEVRFRLFKKTFIHPKYSFLKRTKYYNEKLDS